MIKNCEEVGLFEDLRNVNPFDETFRRACEQNAQHTPLSHQHFQTDEESLHTPQVFPQFDAAVEGGICAGEDLTKQTLDTPVVLAVSPVDNILDVPTTAVVAKPKCAEITSITKYRHIAEKPAAAATQNAGITILPSATVQFVQPQLITLAFPSTSTETINCTTSITLTPTQHKNATKTKPLLLPKLATSTNTTTKDTLTTSVSSTCTATTPTSHPEPSSASLTPTSQLPIKERLKAILNQSSKSRPPEWPDKTSSSVHFSSKSSSSKATSSYCSLKSSKDDTMERRRAASTRYRHKMRNEHRDLKKRNLDLQIENDRLKEKIKQLQAEVTKLQSSAMQPVLGEYLLFSKREFIL